MLVELNLNWDECHLTEELYNKYKNFEDNEKDQSFMEYLNYKLSDVATPISKGVYEYCNCNTSELLENLSIKYDEHLYIVEKDGNYFRLYGVCDDYKQIIGYHTWLEKDKDKYVIILYKIEKNKQPSIGGWRWHKWGEYIGTQVSTHEYIYDEPNIDFVYVYQIYKIFD